MFAIVRKSDMLVTAVNASATLPDPNLFLEIDTAQDLSGISTKDYRYNQYDSTFYVVGVKAQIAEPEVPLVKTSAFAVADGKRARLTGSHFGVCAANSETVLEFTVPGQGRFLTGAEYFAENPTIGDTISFEVHHPVAGILDSFAKDWHVMPGRIKYELYPAWVPGGLKIKIKYTNTHQSNAVTFACNLFLHLDETKPD